MTVVDQAATFFNENFSLLILTVVGFAVGVLVYKHLISKDAYEFESLDVKVKDSLNDILRELGKGLDKTVRYRLDVLGVIDKDYWFRTVSESDKEDDSEQSKAKKWDCFNVRPKCQLKNPFPAAFWWLFDNIFNLGWFESIYVVPSDAVDRKDQIVISKEIDFAKVGGIYVPRTNDGLELVKDQATIKLYADTVERFSNLVDLMNFLDMKFSKDIKGMEKYYELEGQKWLGREDSAVESG